MKGQALKGQSVGNIGVQLVIAAVFVIVGVLIFANVYDSVPLINRVVVNETLTNITTGDPVGSGTLYTATVANTPVYIGGPALGDGTETNMTLTYLNATGLNWVAMTHQTGGYSGANVLPGADEFNYSSAGTITANATYNGTVVVTYTQHRGSENVMPTFRNLRNQSYNANQLLAVALIVLAAVTIMSILFLLGRRA